MTEQKSDKKLEREAIEKTAKAQGTLSEKEALKKAEDSKKVTEEMIKDSNKNSEESPEEVAEEVVKEEKEEDRRPRRETREERFAREEKEKLLGWEPKTALGREVQNGKVKNIDDILDNDKKILEEHIVDTLIDVKHDLISIGQAKGKFGGGKRRAWRQTQKKTMEGNVPTFSTMAVVGDEKGHVGIGVGKAKETLPARDKALRQAKLNLVKIKRSCSSFDCQCSELHTVPFKVEGKSGSVRVILIPAPQGTGIVAAKELRKILGLAGIKDVYTKTFGKQRTTFNLVRACFEALKKTTRRD